MSASLKVAAAAAGALALIAVGAGPASASNPVLTHSWATGKYEDLTDQLCARITSGFDTNATWATAQIVKNGNVVFSKTDYGNGDGAFSCTGNLSIPEDQSYTLVVQACTIYANPRCTQQSTSFFS